VARITMALEWFEKILKDYSNWVFAWAREAGQNSLDAGATAISATVALNGDGNTVVTWADNGKGMNRDTLETRFMAVGGSKKDEGNAGGFGIAKLLLAFAHVCYVILTGGMRVVGRNDVYDIETDEENRKGMTLIVTMKGDVTYELSRRIREWVSFTTPTRDVLFYLNGELIPFMGKLPAPVSEQDWCSIHVMDSESYGVKVRINGQFMFNVYTGVEKAIMVELTGSSLVYLTSNRDGMQWDYRDKLTKLVESLTRDPELLIDTENDVIEIYKGELGAIEIGSSVSQRAPAARMWDATADDMASVSDEMLLTRRDTQYGTMEEFRERETLLPRNDFVIMNRTNKAIPHKYTLAGMRPMEWRQLDRWTRIVRAVATVLGIKRRIRTGWIFSIKAQAAYKRQDGYSLVMLNPCKLEGSEWVKAFDTSRDCFYELVALAVHELTHVEHSHHDEAYAGALTDNMGTVFANMAVINKAKTDK